MHVYVFDIMSRASIYGIGTYISMLKKVLIHNQIKTTFVICGDSGNELTITYRQHTRYIKIPKQQFNIPSDYLTEQSQYYKALIITLLPYIDKTETNIFHLNYLSCLALAQELKKYLKCKIVLTIHYTHKHYDGEDKFAEIPGEYEQAKILLNQYCDKIIAISKHIYHDIITLYNVSSYKIILIPNCLPDQYKQFNIERYRMKMHWDTNDILIIYAGRLDPIKGVNLLPNAFEKILMHYKNVRLIIASNNNILTYIHSIPLKSRSRITFMGFISHKELYQLFSAVDIGVVPSLYEPFGYVAIEMMMCGLPLIINDRSGLAEIVPLNVGVHVNLASVEDSIDNLVRGLEQLISNKQLRIKYGNAGRMHFLKAYRFSDFSINMNNLYKDL